MGSGCQIGRWPWRSAQLAGIEMGGHIQVSRDKNQTIEKESRNVKVFTWVLLLLLSTYCEKEKDME